MLRERCGEERRRNYRCAVYKSGSFQRVAGRMENPRAPPFLECADPDDTEAWETETSIIDLGMRKSRITRCSRLLFPAIIGPFRSDHYCPVRWSRASVT